MAVHYSYKVVQAENVYDLERQVESLIKEDWRWKPQGGVVVISTHNLQLTFFQAMFKIK